MSETNELRTILAQIQTDLANNTKSTNEKIDALLKKIEEKDAVITTLEERVSFLEKKNELLERKIDDNESYHRRQSLRIIGIPLNENGVKETESECLNKVKAEVVKLGVNLSNCEFDRAHRIGAIKKDRAGNVLPNPMIVRFSSWRARTEVYRNRIKKGNVRFYIDLTKRRFVLKQQAMEETKDNPLVSFVFADINNNLCIKVKSGELKFFLTLSTNFFAFLLYLYTC